MGAIKGCTRVILLLRGLQLLAHLRAVRKQLQAESAMVLLAA